MAPLDVVDKGSKTQDIAFEVLGHACRVSSHRQFFPTEKWLQREDETAGETIKTTTDLP